MVGRAHGSRRTSAVAASAGSQLRDNPRSKAALDVVDLIVRGDKVLVWKDDGNGGSKQDEQVTMLPGQIEWLDCVPGHLIYGLPQL